jgi:AcrR family transcriptional regulator
MADGPDDGSDVGREGGPGSGSGDGPGPGGSGSAPGGGREPGSARSGGSGSGSGAGSGGVRAGEYGGRVGQGGGQGSGGRRRRPADELKAPQKPKKYDSPVRRRQVAETRERILAAGAELLHGFPIWNWSGLTVPAVAERAGVTERTVYRYFSSERGLRDAVMVRLQEEADVQMDGLRLEDVAEVAARIMKQSATFPIVPRTPPRDPTVAAATERQNAALLAAVAAATEGWSDEDRAIAAGMLDLLWSSASYERLVTDWHLDLTQAIRGITWVIRMIEAAIRAGERPGG